MTHDIAENIAEYIEALCASSRLGPQVAHHRVLDAIPASTAANVRPWPKAISDILAERNIGDLYTHQALATDMVRAGRHVVAATPTASGKSLIYSLPVLERALQDPDATSLFLFPLKALAQDQLGALGRLTAHWPEAARLRAAIYDGDTTAWFRKKIRENPPQALLTNPDMMHLSMLPHHEQWARLWAGLSFVVVDEVHTYRGVMGSHMAQVFRRLKRVCARYGADPTFIFCSATVGNPGALAHDLTGLDAATVTECGAPQAKRHFVFLNPEQSPATTAIWLLKSALARNLRTIVYAQSRKMTELISLWAGESAGKYKDRISAYRAGLLPEERREVEARMHSGDLLAVISTSALELGIDIGGLDLCILVGYPGSVMATLQRGGRVGRAGRESAVVLVAQEDALDQYFMRHPEDFFARPPESAVCNPANPVILARHLECAAAELPLDANDPWLTEPGVAEVVRDLERNCTLVRSREGDTLFAQKKRPHRHVHLRGSGGQITIEDTATGEAIGHFDESRAVREGHPGAIYLHRGVTYEIQSLDLPGKRALAKRARAKHYTRIRANKQTVILEVQESRAVWGTRMYLGRLRVTEQITGYEKRRTRDGVLLSIVPLDLPPQSFETQGVWFEIPLEAQRRAEANYLHFMGGIHALEHAAIGIAPLLILTDRDDLGGISTPMHPQVGLPAVFIYDGAPGGVGLTAQAFTQAEELFERTLATVADCPCDLGCPSCVHSPKCGSGNRPIDKASALFLLRDLKDMPAPDMSEPHTIVIQTVEQPSANPSCSSSDDTSNTPENKETPMLNTEWTPKPPPANYAVVDVETRRSADEVGGWHLAHKMGISVAVVYYSATDEFVDYAEDEIPALAERLATCDLVIGFNTIRFDYKVLGAHTTADLRALPSLDLLQYVHNRLGYRLKLDTLAQATLNAPKSADGLQALAWWKEGNLEAIAKYCRQDVAITRDLYLYGLEHGHVLYSNKAGNVVRLPVEW